MSDTPLTSTKPGTSTASNENTTPVAKPPTPNSKRASKAAKKQSDKAKKEKDEAEKASKSQKGARGHKRRSSRRRGTSRGTSSEPIREEANTPSKNRARHSSPDNLSSSWEQMAEPTSDTPMSSAENIVPLDPAKVFHERPKPYEGLVTSRFRNLVATKRASHQLAVLTNGILTFYHIKAKGKKEKDENVINCEEDLANTTVHKKAKSMKFGFRRNRLLMRIASRVEFDEWSRAIEEHRKFRLNVNAIIQESELVDDAIMTSLNVRSVVSNGAVPPQPAEMEKMWSDIDVELREACFLVSKSGKQLKELEDGRTLLRKVAEVMNTNRVKSALVHFNQVLDGSQKAHETMCSALHKLIKVKRDMRVRYKQMNPAAAPLTTTVSMDSLNPPGQELDETAYFDANSVTAMEEDDSSMRSTMSSCSNTTSKHGGSSNTTSMAINMESQPIMMTPPPSPSNGEVDQTLGATQMSDSCVPMGIIELVPPTPPPTPTPPRFERRKELSSKAPVMPFGASMAITALKTGRLPIQMFQPLSMLQVNRPSVGPYFTCGQIFAEDMTYTPLIDAAILEIDPAERLALVTAFAISAYTNSAHRARKPFGSLLGETFEWDRWDDLGWRFMSEQIEHSPDVTACTATGRSGWRWAMCAEIPRPAARLWASTIDIQWKPPLNGCRLSLDEWGEEYRWNKVTTVLVDPTGAERYVTHYGEMTVTASSGYKSQVVFNRADTQRNRNFFNDPRLIQGRVFAPGDTKHPLMTLTGSWSGDIYRRKTPADSKLIFTPQSVTQLNYRSECYAFSDLAMQANEMTSDLVDSPPAITDSRTRPDQQAFENGQIEESGRRKMQIEQSARDRRATRERTKEAWVPLWFKPSYVYSDGKKTTTKKDVQWWESKEEYWGKKANKFADVKCAPLW